MHSGRGWQRSQIILRRKISAMVEKQTACQVESNCGNDNVSKWLMRNLNALDSYLSEGVSFSESKSVELSCPIYFT